MTRSASDILSQEFLQVRAKILEVAAFFDRFEQAAGADNGQGSPDQLRLLQQGCALLTDGEGDKAARMQLLFSREYRPDWREEFQI
jgi:hypothetical protein